MDDLDERHVMMAATVIMFAANVYRLKYMITHDSRLYCAVSFAVLAYWVQVVFFPTS